MQFRIRCKWGQFVINEPTFIVTSTTLYDLKLSILIHLKEKYPQFFTHPPDANEMYDLVQYLELKPGYPIHHSEQLVTFGLPESNSSSLKALGIQAMDLIIIEFAMPATPPKKDQVSVFVKEKDMHLILRQSPDDNSCLFHSINTVLTKNQSSIDQLRMLCATWIMDRPDMYTDVFLGRPRLEYCNWLTKSQSWGGAIELDIFSQYFQTEICSVDVLTRRIDRFGDGKFNQRAFVVYNSIHFDALGLTNSTDTPTSEFDMTVFPTTDTYLLEYAMEIAFQLFKEARYTDTANFTLSCNDCGVGLRGQDAALEHTRVTKVCQLCHESNEK